MLPWSIKGHRETVCAEARASYLGHFDAAVLCVQQYRHNTAGPAHARTIDSTCTPRPGGESDTPTPKPGPRTKKKAWTSRQQRRGMELPLLAPQPKPNPDWCLAKAKVRPKSSAHQHTHLLARNSLCPEVKPRILAAVTCPPSFTGNGTTDVSQ